MDYTARGGQRAAHPFTREALAKRSIIMDLFQQRAFSRPYSAGCDYPSRDPRVHFYDNNNNMRLSTATGRRSNFRDKKSPVGLSAYARLH